MRARTRTPRRRLPAALRLAFLSLVAILPFCVLLTPDQRGNAAATLAATLSPPGAAASSSRVPPVHTVSYDRYSLLVDGHRLVLFGGEYQFWRTPSPDRWPVVLREMRAAGLNAVSVGISWQYHSPAPGVYNFSGIRDLGRFLDDAAAAGLYVIARPGPVNNTESSASSVPGWLLARTRNLRANGGHDYCGSGAYSPAYAAAYTDWYRHVLPIIAARQLTTGHGTVVAMQIENEYSPRCGDTRYMRDLHDLAREEGIDVPLIANNNVCCVAPGAWHQTGDDGQPIVDIPAEDDYPCVTACTANWDGRIFGSIDTLESRLRHAGVTDAPLAVAELQGGYYTGWGQQSYARMSDLYSPALTETLDGSVLGQGVTLTSIYMVAGGTSWGYLGGPNTVTSYDYDAPIHEWGTPGASYDALKRTGMFVDAFNDLLGATERTRAVTASNPSLLYAARRTVDGPQRGALFIVLRNTDPHRWSSTRLHISLSGRSATVPHPGVNMLGFLHVGDRTISLPPHSLTMLVANYHLGPFTLRYSTSRPLTQATVNGDRIVVLYGTPGTDGETALAFAHAPRLLRVDPGVDASYDRAAGELRLDYRHAEGARYVVLSYQGHRLILVLTGPNGAAHTWRVHTARGPALVMGPSMVTGATMRDGALHIEASLNGKTGVTVWAPRGPATIAPAAIHVAAPLAHAVSGSERQTLPVQYDATLRALSTSLPAPAARATRLTLPALTRWRFHVESPETSPGFDDSHWRQANERSTHNPNVPASDTLLADDYGFHYGFVWYRGSFTSTGKVDGLRIFARNSYSVWLNGHYLGSSTRHNDLKNVYDQLIVGNPRPSNASYADGLTFHIDRRLLRKGKKNVIAVLTENLGHNIGFSNGQLSRSPAGILSARLVGRGKLPGIRWRIQGAAGGEQSYKRQHDGIDSPLNASGLYGERHGWYEPGYDDRSWRTVRVPDDWKARGLHLQGVGWYRTTFKLNLPPGVDAPIGLVIPHAQDKVVIWLNGLLIGRYWDGVGPQHAFYLPAGLLHQHGRNTLALAVWNRGHDGGLTGGVYLRPYNVSRQTTLTIARNSG